MNTLFESKHTKIIQTKEGLEYIERKEAACILAVTEGKMIMVEQNRGPFGKTLEVPAGKVDEGESPLEAASRELEEETGYKVTSAKHLISYYPSVGYTTEVIHCYFSDQLLDTGKQRLDDGERIKVRKLTPEDLYDMIKQGEIKDSKTIMCVYSAIMDFDL